MRNVALLLKFVGTNYSGWQRQKNADSIQGALEDAIAHVTGAKSGVTGCSRTDAGVHANFFVCNFKTDATIPEKNLPLALNSFLPGDIAVQRATDVPEPFNARFDCVKKEYVYRIYQSKIRDPFLENRAYRYIHAFDLEEAKSASRAFVGTHDFTAFAASGRTTKTSVRTIYSSGMEKKGGEIFFIVSGDGFLYNMVRIMAGTLLLVAGGKIKAADIERIIKSRDRKEAGPTAPAHGLYLNRVFYEDKEF